MSLVVNIFPYTLKFKFLAGTSRGVMKERKIFLINIFSSNNSKIVGWGECAPLPKLSLDDFDDYHKRIRVILNQLCENKVPQNKKEIYDIAFQLAGYEYPSLRFGIETALLDLMNNGNFKIFDNDFYYGRSKIPINGLVWMGDVSFMKNQIKQKILDGFKCLKLKIGSIDFGLEKQLLEEIRFGNLKYKSTLRLDANGAFLASEALEKINLLKKYQIHSIEQPIKPGQIDRMREICKLSPIPIALDEELIGINTLDEKQKLLDLVKPRYIIIKPTLVGGIQSSSEWINLANERNISWWITSSLESNIGLNALAQFTYQMNAKGFQGLGTGQLYHNNFSSSLYIRNVQLGNDISNRWKINT